VNFHREQQFPFRNPGCYRAAGSQFFGDRVLGQMAIRPLSFDRFLVAAVDEKVGVVVDRLRRKTESSVRWLDSC